jgi:hypothetical protein
VARPRSPISLDSFVPARLLDGLELHLGETGPTLEADGCGSLLLWSEALRTREDPVFSGSVVGRVLSETPDTVIRVKLEPTGMEQEPSHEGRFGFASLLPGVYHLVLITPQGPITRREIRVFAHREYALDLEVKREVGEF